MARKVAVGAGASGTSTSTEARAEMVSVELKALEAERDEALSVGESCAKTCVKLMDMVKLLDDLSLEKVRAGDEAGAKAALHERAAIKEVLTRSETRARNNFMLASKLAEKIGEKQNELLSLASTPRPVSSTLTGGSSIYAGVRSSSSSSAGGATPPGASTSSRGQGMRDFDGGYGGAASPRLTTAPSRSSSGDGGSGSSDRFSNTGYGFGSSSSSSSSSRVTGFGGNTSSGAGSGSGSNYRTGAGVEAGSGAGYGIPAWQASLEAAAARLKQQEATMNQQINAARMTADDSIAAAKARLAAKAGESILDARGRLQTAAERSLAEARERIRKQDEEILAYCRKIVARYQRGERVSDDDLEYAFQQLERRSRLS